MNIPYEKLSRQQLYMIQLTTEMAKKSALSFHVGSILFNSGIEIVSDCNRHGDLIQDPAGTVHNVCAIHAEMAVCMAYYKKHLREGKSLREIKRLVLCVVRRNNNGRIRNAKPCMECTDYLKKWLPCKIIYSTDDGFFFGKVRDLETDHLSYIQIKRRSSPKGRLSHT